VEFGVVERRAAAQVGSEFQVSVFGVLRSTAESEEERLVPSL
jgi:hypothetical protein